MKAFPAHPQHRVRRQIVKLQPVVRSSYEVLCMACGEWFPASRSDARYCSGRCRSRAFRRRQKERRDLVKMQKTEPLFDRPLYPGTSGDPELERFKAETWRPLA